MKHLIETINGGKKGKYEKGFMKIRFESDDNLPLNNILKLHMLTAMLDLFLKKMINIIHKFF